ncbi:hypothetical protein DUI87_19847 [Hirundo rustica rustica]|uniref:Uncharacterized protein n=1 Tax=Hirundo rustica rustica TaxID=333673 RepID=A0A3M0JP82_HIRRU|nr:hypothetical protein DUI87_19847 [Hirundo rustica rustica]
MVQGCGTGPPLRAGPGRSHPSGKSPAICSWLPNLAPKDVGCQPSPEGGNGEQRLLPGVPPLLELGKLSLPGELSLPRQLDGGTSDGASGRDPGALGAFQGEQAGVLELGWGSMRSVRDPTR